MLGKNAFALAGDVTKLESAPSLVAQAEKLAGPLTILVNNAGVHLKKPAMETSDAEFAAVLQTHVFGAFALTREAGRRMVERRSGCVLFTASMASFMGIPQVVAYSAAKSAYLGLVRALATEWGPHGVRVNAIAPGWIASDMLDQALSGDPARKAKIIGRTPMLARFGEPDDVGWAAVYLASPGGKICHRRGVAGGWRGGDRFLSELICGNPTGSKPRSASLIGGTARDFWSACGARRKPAAAFMKPCRRRSSPPRSKSVTATRLSARRKIITDFRARFFRWMFCRAPPPTSGPGRSRCFLAPNPGLPRTRSGFIRASNRSWNRKNCRR